MLGNLSNSSQHKYQHSALYSSTRLSKRWIFDSKMDGTKITTVIGIIVALLERRIMESIVSRFCVKTRNFSRLLDESLQRNISASVVCTFVKTSYSSKLRYPTFDSMYYCGRCHFCLVTETASRILEVL